MQTFWAPPAIQTDHERHWIPEIVECPHWTTLDRRGIQDLGTVRTLGSCTQNQLCIYFLQILICNTNLAKEVAVSQVIGTRMRALRKERGLSQDDMAFLFGFKDRQTVSAIETGMRRVTATELLLAVEKLNAPLEYFTDPFRLDGEALFSWRQTNVAMRELQGYERAANRWIGAYRNLSAQVGRTSPLMRQTLGLAKHSKFEDAMDAGERFVDEFGLGPVPAKRLTEVMEDRLGILVLLVDAYQGISGAACRLPEFDTVLVARGEPATRRNFDLAHELFHILTWEAMPPDHVENANEFGGGRAEQLANSFAAALLMPRATLEAFGDCNELTKNELIARLNAAANELNVSSSALRWRLVALRMLKKSTARSIPDTALRNNGGENNSALPPLFSRSFVEVIATAIELGHLSVRRASRLIGVSIEELQELFADHGVECAIDL